MAGQNLEISGYRVLSPGEVERINQIKAQGQALEELLDMVDDSGGDPRWSAIAKTHLQQGLMALTRAVAKPEFF